jgi:YfiH family protein
LVHSGWKGTLESIAKEMIDQMQKEYSSNVKDIIIGIGPGIGACCYEVGPEVYNRFINKHENYSEFFKKKKYKYMLDLKGIIRKDLMDCGILEENIEISKLCTKCRMDLFFSHRAQGLKRGGMAAVINISARKPRGLAPWSVKKKCNL